jgi:HSP20 family protein
MFGLSPYNRRRNEVNRRDQSIFDFENFFERFFDDSLFSSILNTGRDFKVDIKDNPNEYVVEAELPGIAKDQINIELKDDILTITVERKEEIQEERENYIRRERKYGTLSRSFYVENIKNEDVTAKFNNGVLKIVLPKKENKQPKGRKIDIM